jgi:hypothetical protein
MCKPPEQPKTKDRTMSHFISNSGTAILLGLSVAGAVLDSSACSAPGAASDNAPTLQQGANAKIQEAKDDALKTQTEARSKMAGAQKEATKDVAAAQKEATKDVAAATQEAKTTVAEADQKARGEGAQAQANANVEIRKANQKATSETTDLRAWSQKKMDDLDNAIDAARAKEQTAAPKGRASFEAGMKAVEIRRDALRAEVASLETQTAKGMADFKDRLDKAGNQLKQRVSELSAAL